MPVPPRSWSLSDELYTLEAAVEAARILTEAVACDQFGTEADLRLAPVAAAAVLTLVTIRTRDIGRMLRGELSAQALCATHNAAVGKVDRHDIVFGRKAATRAASRRKSSNDPG
jgi:hypothetical protein